MFLYTLFVLITRSWFSLISRRMMYKQTGQFHILTSSSSIHFTLCNLLSIDLDFLDPLLLWLVLWVKSFAWSSGDTIFLDSLINIGEINSSWILPGMKDIRSIPLPTQSTCHHQDQNIDWSTSVNIETGHFVYLYYVSLQICTKG